MQYEKFLELLRGGEKSTVDFKIICDAFNTGGLAAKAELVKDICAMANNGGAISHIVIGVSDDRKSYKSVNNLHLTDDNVQNFCKKSIFPPPRVRVDKNSWPNAKPGHANKKFVVLRIGPHQRQAFRIATDFIDYGSKICVRRNDVWIRRGATTDLATPEEIARLVSGKAPIEDSAVKQNTRYDRVPVNARLDAIYYDLDETLNEAGCRREGNLVTLRFDRMAVCLHLIVLQAASQKFAIWEAIFQKWNYEHGALIIVRESIASRAFHHYASLHFGESWGFFTVYEWPSIIMPSIRYRVPANTTDFSLVGFSLPSIRDSSTLRNKVLGMIDFVRRDNQAKNALRAARTSMNKNLRRWIKWEKNPELLKSAQKILNSSKVL